VSVQQKQQQITSEKYNMEQISITKASLEDFETIQVIGRQTFLETFADSNTASDMNKYLEENFSEQKIRIEISNPDSMFFIAWDEGNPVGYLKINTGKAQTELQEENSLEIERIYVKSSHHGKKVGQLLCDKALETGLLQNKAYLWLGVWEENPRAIRFYEKNGFVAFDKHIFKMGNDEQTDIMMKKTLPVL
jgi:ribosomal protein S18 acetylase RimI-like enzyme